VNDREGEGGVGMHGSEWNGHVTMTVSVAKIEDDTTRSPWMITMATCLPPLPSEDPASFSRSISSSNGPDRETWRHVGEVERKIRRE